MDKIAKSINEINMKVLKFPILVLYDSPSGYKGKYVVRVFENMMCLGGKTLFPTDTVILYTSEEDIEADLSEYTRVYRHDSNDPTLRAIYYLPRYQPLSGIVKIIH